MTIATKAPIGPTKRFVRDMAIRHAELAQDLMDAAAQIRLDALRVVDTFAGVEEEQAAGA